MSLLKFLSPTVKVYRSSDRSFVYGEVYRCMALLLVYKKNSEFLAKGVMWVYDGQPMTNGCFQCIQVKVILKQL